MVAVPSPAGGPLHIGYIVQQFLPEVGAGPARVTEMGLQWLEAGHSLTVLTAVPSRPQGVVYPGYRGRLIMEDTWRGMRVIRTWVYASPKGGFVPRFLNNASFLVTGGAAGVARTGGVDVLIASAPPLFPHLIGGMVSAARGIPLVLEIRDLWPDFLVGMGMLREGSMAANAMFGIERSILRRATRVVVVTESFKRRVAMKGIDASRIDVIPNGVDATFYHRSDLPIPIDALRRRGDELVVGYLGNFGKAQGLVHVIEGVALAASRGVPVRLVLVGDGTDRPAIERAARAAGPDTITVLPAIAKALTPAFYANCDLCAVPLAPFPILQETIPSKIFEILACERPVLGSFGGEAAAILHESGGGLVVPPGDADAIAAALATFVELGADARARMGAAGRAFVVREYNRTTLAMRYLDVLRSARDAGRA